jgi:23S rRNA pseudouridine1911/1915/1917 synthase
MPSRLDRETSGVMVFARDRETGCRLQNAALRGAVTKTYYAVVTGRLSETVTVDQPIGRDSEARFYSRRWVVEGGQAARTEFIPLGHASGYTLVRVHPRTGRRHQIRVHAAWLGHPIAGDKLYGADPWVMLEFVANGFSDKLLSALPLPRHALHAAEVRYLTDSGEEIFQAPFTADLIQFCAGIGLSVPESCLPQTISRFTPILPSA